MKPEAEVVLIEFKEGDLPQGPSEAVKISKKEMVSLMQSAGFTRKEEKAGLLPYEHVLVFQGG